MENQIMLIYKQNTLIILKRNMYSSSGSGTVTVPQEGQSASTSSGYSSLNRNTLDKGKNPADDSSSNKKEKVENIEDDDDFDKRLEKIREGTEHSKMLHAENIRLQEQANELLNGAQKGLNIPIPSSSNRTPQSIPAMHEDLSERINNISIPERATIPQSNYDNRKTYLNNNQEDNSRDTSNSFNESVNSRDTSNGFNESSQPHSIIPNNIAEIILAMEGVKLATAPIMQNIADRLQESGVSIEQNEQANVRNQILINNTQTLISRITLGGYISVKNAAIVGSAFLLFWSSWYLCTTGQKPLGGFVAAVGQKVWGMLSNGSKGDITPSNGDITPKKINTDMYNNIKENLPTAPAKVPNTSGAIDFIKDIFSPENIANISTIGQYVMPAAGFILGFIGKGKIRIPNFLKRK
jgi:hypothetical protein